MFLREVWASNLGKYRDHKQSIIILSNIPSRVDLSFPNIRSCALLGTVVGVLHVGDANDCIGDPVVHHRIHGHCYGVLGEELKHVDVNSGGEDAMVVLTS